MKNDGFHGGTPKIAGDGLVQGTNPGLEMMTIGVYPHVPSWKPANGETWGFKHENSG